jgi:arginyl-tRNA synthetase
MLPHKTIEQRLRQAVRTILPDADTSIVLVRPCPDPKFGDYQSNALMPLAKGRKLNPRQLATDVVAKLTVDDICEKVEVAGAGFLNFRLKVSALTEALESAERGEHLFFAKAAEPGTVVIDFSSPNVAKPMHVGHIRSTILGDSLARIFRLLGHRVITDNHIGDWGTQFGMLLFGWKTLLDPEQLKRDPLAELERIYKLVNPRCDPKKPDFDQATLDRVRAELVRLQAGDPENLAIWREMQRLSQAQFDTIYGRLGVKFDHALGESFYNPHLAGVVQDLRNKGIARESEGAIVAFFDDHPQLKETPALIQKSDGAFNYATTDLATLRYRMETWQPDQVLYVTDARQQLHFQQVFAIFRRWQPESKVDLQHIWFGSILGEDGKPLKTRSGENVPLAELLNEAEERAFQVVSQINTELPEPERREIARVVGIGAVKYADLLPNRQTDYVFSWEKMLALNGNSAPYLQYAFARTRSVFRKAGKAPGSAGAGGSPKVILSAPEEIALAKILLNFGIVLEGALEEYRPNFLCNYLYEVASLFARFWENCPVLKAEPEVSASRLVLCHLTGSVLKQGLEVLGIETLEQM